MMGQSVQKGVTIGYGRDFVPFRASPHTAALVVRWSLAPAYCIVAESVRSKPSRNNRRQRMCTARRG
jgi:hypothetical protein